MKGHRRSDSSTSELSSPVELSLAKAPPLKPNVSPIVPCLTMHITPPQAFGSSNLPSMSSPKKLLTPIKKMFGHHGKSGSLSATVDPLNSVVFGEFEPPKGRKPIGANSLTNLTDLRNGPYPSHSPQIYGYRSLSLLEAPALTQFELLATSRLPKACRSADTWSDSSQELKNQLSRKAAFTIDPRLETETTDSLLLELVVSKARTSLENERLPSNTGNMIGSLRNDSETVYEADDDLRDSDTSSQFSFVKDMVGGRNTSIKYYKTKSQMKKAQPPKDYLVLEDLSMDNYDAHSDYDFENNGLGDDDYEDDGFETNDRFNDFLSEESASNTTSDARNFDAIPPAFALEKSKRASFNDEYPDLDEFLESSPIHKATLLDNSPDMRSPGYCDDFLDAYLDKSRLPLPAKLRYLELSVPKDILSHKEDDEKSMGFMQTAPIPHEPSRVVLNKSRIDEGPIKSIQKKQDLAESRKSITDIIGILSTLEAKSVAAQEDGGASSVNNIMEILDRLEKGTEKGEKDKDLCETIMKQNESLSSLEQIVSTASPHAKAQIRQSIADMMNTLSILDVHLENKTANNKYRSKMAEKPFAESAIPGLKKRYSWFNEGEKIGNVSESGYDDSTDNIHGSLDQDLIDEINMLPEDYDFDELPVLEQKKSSGFYRTNSYNKKPERVVKEFKYQDQKIHTPLKTVTFYRGNSEHSLNVVPSRTGSNMSMTSFTSIDDQEDLDLQDEATKKHAPLRHVNGSLHNVHIASPLYFTSSDSLNRRSENLEPINESDNASI